MKPIEELTAQELDAELSRLLAEHGEAAGEAAE